MGFVHVLDDRVRELISAGEVVERPASVVKELVENSLDAGATRIDIELRDHGISMISVTDNGSGLVYDDIKLAFMRHATSKIRDAEDLDAIGSLGFRGEALASIAAVSRVRMTTKTPDNVTGYRYIIEGGKEVSLEECGTPTGTNVTVADLFYNTPARMKFLKKDVAEGNACEQLIWHMALCYPDVSFRMIREGKLALRTTGQGLYSAIFDLFPRDVAASMKQVDYSSEDGVVVSGFISAPTQSRASRSLQHISVNGRYVRNRSIQAAAEEACKGFIMQGKFPAFVISVTVPLDSVDVNVHPAKTEIRFTNERSVTRAVYRAVRESVQDSGRTVPEFDAADTVVYSDENPVSSASEKTEEYPADNKKVAVNEELQFSFRKDPAKDIFDDLVRIDGMSEAERVQYSFPSRSETSLDIMPDPQEEAFVKGSAEPEPQVQEYVQTEIGRENEEKAPTDLRVIGELFNTYILAETGDMLVFIDMHAAHERILFELLNESKDTVDSQLLLEPVVVSLSLEEKQALVDSSEALEKLGFSLTEIGEREVAVREIPTYLKIGSAADAVTEIAVSLLDNREDLTFEAKEWLMHSSACRAAIKAGHKASSAEMISLTESIICGDIPKFCPHGRPVYFTVPKKEIEKRFGRIT